jgi:site-specific recombinase XerD
MQPNDAAAYRFHMQANGLAAPTIKNYLVAHKQWRHWCEANAIDPAMATKSLMMAFLADGAARNMSGTVRLLTLGLRAYGDFLVTQGLRTDNPARSIKPVKQNSRPTEPLTDDDLRALLLACDTAEDRAMLLLLVGGGLRRSEVLNIKAADINPDAGTITINGKGSKYRLIAPGRTAMEAVAAVLSCACRAQAPTDRLFRNSHPDSVRRHLMYLARKAGLNKRVNPHTFRHSFAVRFCDLGGGIDQLQMILGHSSLQMSMYYSRSGRQQRALASQVLHNPADALAVEG